MRAKSSMSSTRRRSRRELRRTIVQRSRSASVASRVGERLVGRPRDQRQRRAELVADVGEELGLGPVDLGQRLGAAALGLVGLRVGDRARHLLRDEVEEAAVLGVELVEGAHAGHEQPDRRRPARDRERQRHGGARIELARGAGAALELAGVALVEPVEDPGAAVVAESPERVAGGRQRGRRDVAAGDDALAGDEACRAVGLEQVGERERHVGALSGEHLDGRRARPLGGLGAGRRELSEPLERAQAPRAEHVRGRLGAGAEQAGDGLVGDRAVGEREVRLLVEAPAAHDQQQVLVERRLAAQDTRDERADHLPDVAPGLLERRAERGRVLVPRIWA